MPFELIRLVDEPVFDPSTAPPPPPRLGSRIAGWSERLNAYIEERTLMPFEWAVNDCITFGAEWIRRCCGVDLLENIHYTNMQEAAALLASKGGIANAITEVLGDPLDKPRKAQRGDVGLVRVEGRLSMVVVNGPIVLGPGEKGLAGLPLTSLEMAWRI